MGNQEKTLVHKEDLDIHKRKGMEKISKMVAVTLGPCGMPVLVERTGEALNGSPLKPRITKDGVSVANECSSDIPEEDVIIQTVKAICQKTNSDAGDGTTTAIVLGNSILREALAFSERNQDISPQRIKKSLDLIAELVISRLDRMSWPVKSYSEITEVATISSNGDREVGKIIAEAFQKVGGDGVVTVDEGGYEALKLEVVEGYRFLRGVEAREAFYNKADMTGFEAEKAAVVIFDGPVRSQTDLKPLLFLLAEVDGQGQMHKDPPPIVIIANEFSRDAIQWMLIQKVDAGINFCPILGPNVGHIRTEILDDLAIFTQAKRLGNGNKTLASIELKDIGSVGKVEADAFKTTLFGGAGSEKNIILRVDILKNKAASSDSPFDQQGYNDRIAALTGGIAKILIGGTTELAIKELYDRVEDAINAARAAIREGVVVGGGTALLVIAKGLEKDTALKNEMGLEILGKALMSPFAQILENTGLSSSEIEGIKNKLLSKKIEDKKVFNAESGEIESALMAGILDPVFVTKAALRNAISISGLLLTAGGAIVNKRGGKI